MSTISPIGNTIDALWQSLLSGRSGVRRVPPFADGTAAIRFAGIAEGFSGEMEDFGELDAGRKKSIRKGLKLMCREIKMGVAAAQLALQHADRQDTQSDPNWDPDKAGVVFGCDHIVTVPEDLAKAYSVCIDSSRIGGGVLDVATTAFLFDRWGSSALSEVTPLWLLKYLPNMPASHVAIYNDFRGPNNSVTYREPSSNFAIGEAATAIRRGTADLMVAGATGSTVGSVRSLQAAIYSSLAMNGEQPESACRPFDLRRCGSVVGEGAAAVILEERGSAIARGATIYGEVIGHGSSVVVSPDGVADFQRAVANAARSALRVATHLSGFDVRELGHVHAHGLGARHADQEESQAIREILDESTLDIPVTAAKSYFGNLGAASGMVELICSLLSIRHGRLFPALHCDSPDPKCGIRIAGEWGVAGDSVLNLNFSPSGQASALVVAADPG